VPKEAGVHLLTLQVNSSTARRITLPREKNAVRIIAMLASCLLTIGFGSFLAASPSFASGGFQYCSTGTSCLNSWNGGPEVNAYSLGDAANNSFDAVLDENTQSWNIQFVGSGNYKADCIGDLGNNSQDARAGLYSDCKTGTVAWGANFMRDTSACPPGQMAFRNNHWGGWLGPSGLTAGDVFYLNQASIVCFGVAPIA
jgi:hypothetical protein